MVAIARILVVEDDPRLSESVALYLRHAGYDVLQAASGTEALDIAARSQPDLLVLDVMLPGADGIEVCRALRAHTEVPVIMLTAKSTEADKLRGLEAGADDYVTKPFSPRELVARVGVVLRRARPRVQVVQAGDLEIDRHLRMIRRKGQAIGVTPTEFRILDALASSPGRPFTRRELAERAFDEHSEALERTIDAHVVNLRRKLERDRRNPTIIVTVFGTGYRLGTND